MIIIIALSILTRCAGAATEQGNAMSAKAKEPWIIPRAPAGIAADQESASTAMAPENSSVSIEKNRQAR